MKKNILKGYVPGAIGRVAELHGAYYHQHAGFGVFFEARVARELAEFMQRYDDQRDGAWFVVVDGRVEGSIVIDGVDAAANGAHLRWFIMSERLRGTGSGNALLGAAIDFCRARGYRHIHLETFEGLQAARHLYEKHGFRLTRQQPGVQWGAEVNEQTFVLSLSV
jgi:RimJ/RimL family protein N-acetyltransferase